MAMRAKWMWVVVVVFAAYVAAPAQDRWARRGMFIAGVEREPPVVSAATFSASELREIFERNKARYRLVEGVFVSDTSLPQVPGAMLMDLRVTQVVDDSTVLLADRKGVAYALITQEARDMYDDQQMGARWYRTDGVYRYTTVMGATQQIRRIALAETREAQFEDFLAHLRGGGRVKAVTSTPCPTCDGQGFLPRERGRLGRQPCPRCRTQKTVREEREVWLTR